MTVLFSLTLVLIMSIVQFSFVSQIQQYYWVGKKIQDLINLENIDPSQIAIISYKHKSLQEVGEVLKSLNLPIFYEKRQDVMQMPHILQLAQMLKFTYTLSQKNFTEADELLPEILAYPFWQIKEEDLWLLSVFSYSRKEAANRLWLSNMLQSEDIEVGKLRLAEPEKIQQIAKFFLFLSNYAKNATAQEVLDKLVGSNQTIIADDEASEFESNTTTVEPKVYTQTYFGKLTNLNENELGSNYKNFYFFKENDDYLNLLTALGAFIDKVKGYKSTEVIYLKDLIEFLYLVENNSLQILDTSPYSHQSAGVNLMTVHKSKGLEFEYVFMINCQQSEWNPKNKGQKLNLPTNLELLPENDTTDDKLRLFYVAITRAKNFLYLTAYNQDQKGKDSQKVEFLEDLWQDQNLSPQDTQKALEVFFKPKKYIVLNTLKQDLLNNLLQNYQLSSTHLNNFVDVTRGGPQNFLETNLLHFPQGKNVFSSYGTAIHAAISAFYHEYKSSQNLPSLDFLQQKFKQALTFERVATDDFEKLIVKGNEKLQIYYESQKDNFKIDSQLEYDFKNQNVIIGQAHITGKIDKLDFDKENKTILVTDFKTGKPIHKWDIGNSDEKIKSIKYQLQLVFYKLLIENSRDFGGKFTTDTAQLEFVEAQSGSKEIVILPKLINSDDVTRLTKLIEIIFEKIKNLDFPDITKYEQNHKGVQDFINDLIEEKA